MRENPWHIRRATHRHYRWYENILDLHALTRSWLSELNAERPAHLLAPAVAPEIRDSLRKLERVAQSAAPAGESLESLLDDTSPDDLLMRLEHAVHLVQAITLRSMLDRVESASARSLTGQLEQASWRTGRDCAARRWPTLARAPVEDLHGVVAATRGNPFHGSGDSDPLLVQRLVSHELRAELRACPHQSPIPATRAVADELCALHAHWLRGFSYALNSRVVIEHFPAPEPGARCRQRWFLIA